MTKSVFCCFSIIYSRGWGVDNIEFILPVPLDQLSYASPDLTPVDWLLLALHYQYENLQASKDEAWDSFLMLLQYARTRELKCRANHFLHIQYIHYDSIEKEKNIYKAKDILSEVG